MVTLTQYKDYLDKRFSGVLSAGHHGEDGEACGMEFLNAFHRRPWSDSPEEARSFDTRELNDIDISDEVRTKYLLPVLAAYDGSLDWPQERQRAVADRLVILTVQRVVAERPGLSDENRRQYRAASTLWGALAAWGEAAAAEARAAAAWGEARAVRIAREKVFIQACQVWLDALEG